MLPKKSSDTTPGYTRTINPKLGWLGVLCLLGLLGFLPDSAAPGGIITTPLFFMFFGFFGFFGFFYEGKMSGTLMDERFVQNAFRAQATAHKTGLCLIYIVTLALFPVLRLRDAQAMLSIIMAVVGFSLGLASFLSPYLLYRYENEE